MPFEPIRECCTRSKRSFALEALRLPFARIELFVETVLPCWKRRFTNTKKKWKPNYNIKRSIGTAKMSKEPTPPRANNRKYTTHDVGPYDTRNTTLTTRVMVYFPSEAVTKPVRQSQQRDVTQKSTQAACVSEQRDLTSTTKTTAQNKKDGQ